MDEALIQIIERQSSSKKGIKSFKERKEDEHINNSKWSRRLRIVLQSTLLGLLSTEILFICYVMISQGIKRLLFTDIPFELNNWAFATFINVAIVQTCVLINPIANSLFPSGK